MNTSIFKYGELPEFKEFTPENIRKQFPLVLEKIAEDFQNIENLLAVAGTTMADVIKINTFLKDMYVPIRGIQQSLQRSFPSWIACECFLLPHLCFPLCWLRLKPLRLLAVVVEADLTKAYQGSQLPGSRLPTKALAVLARQ